MTDDLGLPAETLGFWGRAVAGGVGAFDDPVLLPATGGSRGR